MEKRGFLLLSILVFLGCIKVVPNSGNPFDNSTIVVEGGINTGSKVQAIRISNISTSTLSSPYPISGLQVKITSAGENLVFKESTYIPGIYTCTLNHSLKTNQVYFLSAESKYQFSNIYAQDTLKKVIPLKGCLIPFSSLSLPNKMVEFQMPKHVFGQKNCLKWLMVSKSGKTWIPDNFDQTYGFSYHHQLGAPNALYSLTSNTNSQTFSLSDSVRIYKFSLSGTHGLYLYGIFEETDWKGIFSGVPSTVKGNISNNGNGFFSAMDIDSKMYLVRDLVGKKYFF